MPRPPRRTSVLRSARQILNLSQQALAELVGCSAITIQKFENGETGVSQDLARRIALETRLDLQQLLTNSNPEEPRGMDGRPLSKAFWEESKKQWQDVIKPEVESELTYDRARLALLYDAGVKARKYRLVAMAVRQRIEELVAEFGLTVEFNELLTEHGLPRAPFDFATWANMPQVMKDFELRREAMYKSPIPAIDKIRPQRPKKVQENEDKSSKTQALHVP